ncbi:MAG: hypothetical protein EON95_20780, partial [Caulobacteraceae bacterium]
ARGIGFGRGDRLPAGVGVFRVEQGDHDLARVGPGLERQGQGVVGGPGGNGGQGQKGGGGEGDEADHVRSSMRRPDHRASDDPTVPTAFMGRHAVCRRRRPHFANDHPCSFALRERTPGSAATVAQQMEGQRQRRGEEAHGGRKGGFGIARGRNRETDRSDPRDGVLDCVNAIQRGEAAQRHRHGGHHPQRNAEPSLSVDHGDQPDDKDRQVQQHDQHHHQLLDDARVHEQQAGTIARHEG